MKGKLRVSQQEKLYTKSKSGKDSAAQRNVRKSNRDRKKDYEHFAMLVGGQESRPNASSITEVVRMLGD